MTVRAMCVNPNCKANGIEQSVIVGQLMGFGAPNDRVVCPVCDKAMKTTEMVNASSVRRPPSRTPGRSMKRKPVSRIPKKRTPRRTPNRRSGRS